MHEDPSSPEKAPSVATPAASPSSSPPGTQDDDRVIITTVEDVRLYDRPLFEVLWENAWVLLIVLGFLAMAIYGVVITLRS